MFGFSSNMSKSPDAVMFAMQSGAAGRQVESKAVLTVTRSKGFKDRPGWKAVISIHGKKKKRIFGSWRASFVESVRALLDSNGHKVGASERDRLLKLVPDMETRRTAAPNTNAANPEGVSSAALSQAPVNAHAPSKENGRQNAVRYVHQVYGLFGDDKPMSALFETSNKQWKDVATLMSAHYHLWKTDEVEALVKQKYPQHWEMYSGVRYPIMRCDMARLMILHAYGGLYADLDTLPNREWYEHAEFALGRVKELKKTTMSSKHGEGMYCEMEIILGTKGNDIFLRWLDHMQAEIKSHMYSGPGAKIFWQHARARYVLHTTGPYSMKRFLSLPSNAQIVGDMKYLELNHFKDAEQLTTNDKRCFDVVTHESNSWFTDEYEIIVAVGAGDTPLPAIPVPTRLRVKCARPHTFRPGARRVAADQVIDAMEVCSREDAKENSEAGRADTVTNGLSWIAADHVIEKSPALANWAESRALADRLTAYQDRESQLLKYFKDYEGTVAVDNVLAGMGHDLAKWLTDDPHDSFLHDSFGSPARQLPTTHQRNARSEHAAE